MSTTTQGRKLRRIKFLQSRIDNIIRVKAFEIYKRDNCDDTERNWFQAIKELSKGI